MLWKFSTISVSNIYQVVFLLGSVVWGSLTPCSAVAEQLWQSSAQGNDIYIFELNSWSLLDKLEVGWHPHGLATANLQDIVWVTVEDTQELLWIEVATRNILHRLKIGPKPQALAVTPDGRWAYVPCRDGYYWVIDLVQRKVEKRIWTGWFPHNTQISPDGERAYLSPMGPLGVVTVVDIKHNHSPIARIRFKDSTRPSSLSSDGVNLFQQVDGLFGFQVADTQRFNVVQTVHHKGRLGWFIPFKPLGWLTRTGFKRCHGLAFRPQHVELWSTCAEQLMVHSAQSPLYPQIQQLLLPGVGYWITFDPQGRFAFIALKDRNQVVVVDADQKKIVKLLDSGQMPKRNLIISVNVQDYSQSNSEQD